ncbi:MAG TPA: hypothetical protein VGJ18_00100 [Gemmatimonadaceae bacterium]
MPSCKICNQGASLDDDYFRTVLLMRRDVGDHPAAAQLITKLHQSWERPEGQGLARFFANNVRDVEVRTPGGLIVERAPGFTVDNTRLARVLERITRGLYFREKGERVRGTHRVIVNPAFERDQPSIAAALRYVTGRDPVKIGDVFWYAWNAASDEPSTTIWLMVFYDAVPFVALTANPSLHDATNIE